MHARDDSFNLMPEDRFREIAAILAAGILRRRQHAAKQNAEGNRSETAGNCLEVDGKPWLSVPAS